MATVSIQGAYLGNALSEILDADDLMPGDTPSYQTCKNVYVYHPLGKKMAETPVTIAMSQAREIAIPKSPEERVKRAFLDEWKAIGADKRIFYLHVLKRVYGVASVGILEEGKKPSDPIDWANFWKSNIQINVYDPLNTAGSLVGDLNPNSMQFLQFNRMAVNGQPYDRSRTCIALNGQPVYLAYTNSSFGYVGRSCYQPGLYLLKSFIETMKADNMVAKKAGLLIAKMESPGSIVDNVMSALFGRKRQLLQEGKTDNVLGIGIKEDVATLNMQNVNTAMDASRKHILENLAASDDMPALLLNNETFAEGFGEGTEDAKRVAAYIDRVREEMEPTYAFFDHIVMRRAWNPEFYQTIQADFPETYADMPFEEAFRRWQHSFTAPWPSLLTEPPSEKVRVADTQLKAIIALVEVLLPAIDPENKALVIEWAQDNFNELKQLFKISLELDFEALAEYQPPQALEEPNEPRPFAAQDTASRRRRMHDALVSEAAQAAIAEMKRTGMKMPRLVA